MDFDADPDWEWRTGALDSPDEVYPLWRAAAERSRELVAEVIKERGLDGQASFTWPDGRTPTVRAMLLDMRRWEAARGAAELGDAQPGRPTC